MGRWQVLSEEIYALGSKDQDVKFHVEPFIFGRHCLNPLLLHVREREMSL